MKQSLLLIISLFITSIPLSAVNFVSSNLPIVIITTDINPATNLPYDIPDDPKVLATMKIIYHSDGNRNFVSDQYNSAYLDYNGRIGIELRGSSSQTLPKKPYGLTTLKSDNVSNNNVSILGMPKENDWILNALAFDASLIRDYLSYDLYRFMGNYSPRQQYCEVIVNGDYKGLYILMEKLKVDENRINITKMTTLDNSGEELTGGYVTKNDKTTGGDPIAWSQWRADFIHDSPKPEDITTQQNNYIYSQFSALANRAAASNASITTGYPDIIDVPSFIDFMIMSEIASNVDSYQLSTYYHKERNGKLRAGPIWDYNLAYGLDVYGNRSLTNVWQFSNGDNEGATFWKNLFNNATYNCYLTKRWKELNETGNILSYSFISNKIDTIVSQITEASTREQARWGTIGTLNNNISGVKTWLANRLNWLNSQLTTYTSCANVTVPPLVISKINYHPADETYSDQLEFIEITNNSNNNTDVTGVYFKELGVTYRFPNNAVLAPKEKIFLASDTAMFRSYYGIKAYGQYYRNLSNKSERLLLVDAFGNVIDDVTYTDTYPWSTDADGNGSFLTLSDVNSDNSLAENWRTSQVLNATTDISGTHGIQLYPVPADNEISIISGQKVTQYVICDLTGKVLLSGTDTSQAIDISSLHSTIYLLKMRLEDGSSVVRKFVKK